MNLKRSLAVAAAAVVAAGGTILGVSLSSAPNTVGLPFTDANGVSISSTCTGTNPQFLIHSGGATVTAYPGSTRFDVTNGGDGLTYSDPYESAGYNNSTDSNACNSKTGDSPVVPVKIGSQGNPVASIHTITGTAPSDYFYGDTGYDIWMTPSPADNTYADMEGVSSFGVATEIMIWTSNTNLVIDSTNVADYPVIIDGQHWYVQVGLAANGHGRCVGVKAPTSVAPLTAASVATKATACAEEGNGWNVVNFIAPNNHVGNVVMSNLLLDPFISYAIAHKYLPSDYYWEGVNAGMEITEGSAQLAGFTLVGMK